MVPFKPMIIDLELDAKLKQLLRPRESRNDLIRRLVKMPPRPRAQMGRPRKKAVA